MHMLYKWTYVCYDTPASRGGSTLLCMIAPWKFILNQHLSRATSEFSRRQNNFINYILSLDGFPFFFYALKSEIIILYCT